MTDKKTHLNDKELILLKMKILYEKAKLMEMTELALGLDHLSRDAWDKVSYLYPQSFKIDN